jgi:RNA polymerase sigma factor (sigma-70 family)
MFRPCGNRICPKCEWTCVTHLASIPIAALTPDDASDGELMQRIAAGDEDAVTIVYRRYSRLAWAIASRSVDEQTACEIVQDAFVCLWRDAARFDPERAGVGTLLAHIVRARIHDRLRRDSSQRRGSGLAGAPLDHAQHVRSETDVEAAVEEAERARVVRAALDELPAQQRVLVELAFLRGYTHSQLSAALGIPPGTVKTRLFRGMAKLRELLAPLLASEVTS